MFSLKINKYNMIGISGSLLLLFLLTSFNNLDCNYKDRGFSLSEWQYWSNFYIEKCCKNKDIIDLVKYVYDNIEKDSIRKLLF